MADLIPKPAETISTSAEQPAVGTSKELGAVIEAVEPAAENLRSPERPMADLESGDVTRDEEPVSEEPVAPIRRAPVRAVAPTKDPTLQKIEDILGEDLTDAFLRLSPDRQKSFKEKGEETASKIQQIIEGAKVNTKKIFDLIRKWLKMIPGINRFFLEQEAKIKTDKILSLKP